MLESVISSEITLTSFFLCTVVSVLLGIGIAAVSMYKSKTTQSFALTVAVLPVVVQAVIMLVNGNLGAGVAVAGAFSLVRFRSAQGTAKEISVLFLSMAIGLAAGMGYLGIAVLLFVIVGAVIIGLTEMHFGEKPSSSRVLRITIPENLDYDGLFDDLLAQYADSWELEQVKTAGMGTVYELKYSVLLKGKTVPKAFLDAIRCRNGNLTVSCAKESVHESL